jgi:hypothetical protein
MLMKSHTKNIFVALVCVTTLWACTRKADDYRAYLNGKELIYPGKITNPNWFPGNLRMLLTWNPSPDPGVIKYVVYWNNNADSQVVSAISHQTTDTIRCLIGHLPEYAYSFFIYSYDTAGNRSVLTEVDNARVYGPVYRNGLHNRLPDDANPAILNSDGTVTVAFVAPDSINITTILKYVNATTNDTGVINFGPETNVLTIPSYHVGTKVLYQSSFTPRRGAIDTFYTNGYDTLPIYVMCDKSLFQPLFLPNDMPAYTGTSLTQLWDGNTQPKDYPNIFHSNTTTLPGTITFDMGKVYNDLTKIEEIGRVSDHNPKEFEVWGIADLSGGASSLQPTDGGWKADMIAKGWTLLGDITRPDANGVNPYDAYLSNNPKPVRYIIIRFISDVDNSGYINLSQLTFWNKQ